MFDRAIAEIILEAVMLGMEPDRAALAAGITLDEHAAWIEQGRSASDGSTELATQGDALVAQYVRDLDRAEAVSEMEALRKVKDGSDAHRWFLERRYAERWAKVPAAVRTEQAKAPAAGAANAGAADGDDQSAGSRMDDLRRKREEKQRAAGGDRN